MSNRDCLIIRCIDKLLILQQGSNKTALLFVFKTLSIFERFTYLLHDFMYKNQIQHHDNNARYR